MVAAAVRAGWPRNGGVKESEAVEKWMCILSHAYSCSNVQICSQSSTTLVQRPSCLCLPLGTGLNSICDSRVWSLLAERKDWFLSTSPYSGERAAALMETS